MANLFEIDQEYLSVLAQVMESDGDLSPELEAEYDRLSAEMLAKEDGYIRVKAYLESQADSAREWSQKMAQKARSFDNQKERLEQRLIEHLHAIGKTEVVSTLGKAKLQESRSCEIIDEAQVPNRYKEQVIQWKLDKRTLLADLKVSDVPGARLCTKEFIRVY